MADHSMIEWTDATWNPITGCSVISPGCTNCYAMKLAGTRLAHHPSREGLTIDTKAGPVWNGIVRFNEGWLMQPLQWKQPKLVFVCAHGDLFHESVPDEWIDKVFAVMALAPQHTFQVLTKRAKRMREYCSDDDRLRRQCAAIDEMFPERNDRSRAARNAIAYEGPLSHVWLGFSAEDQPQLVERWKHCGELAEAGWLVWCSAEPLLGELDFEHVETVPDSYDRRGALKRCGIRVNILTGLHHESQIVAPRYKLAWVVDGGESGHSARACPRQAFQSIRDQCAAAATPYLHKQNGEWIDADEWFDKISKIGTLKVCDSAGVFDEWRPARPLNFEDAARLAEITMREQCEHHSDGSTLIRVGKKAAGRLLDGVEWNQMPEGR